MRGDANRLRRRERELSSLDRETYSRRIALEKQYAFARRNWRLLLRSLFALPPIALAYFLRPFQAGLFIGAYITMIVGYVVHWIVVASGSSQQSMGHQAEVWTRNELRSLPSAWTPIHNARLAAGDIDSIIIGPNGIVVVETKWSGGGWADEFNQNVIRAATTKAEETARRVWLLLKSRVPLDRDAVKPVVALWAPDNAVVTRDIRGGAVVLPGHDLSQWIQEDPRRILDDRSIRLAWDCLQSATASRDAHELETLGPRRRTPTEYGAQLLKYPIGVLVGILASVAVLEVVPLPWAMPLIFGVSAAFRAARSWDSRLRPIAQAAYTTAAWLASAVAIALVGLYVWFAIT